MPWLGKAWQPWLEELKYSRNVGRDVQKNNIDAAESLAEIMKTAYGPHGLDKVIIPPPPQLPKITSDGFTILKETEILHPGAKMVLDLAFRQAQEAGDGVITVVILAGELLKKAKKLLEQKLHPMTIISGYMTALRYATSMLEKGAVPVSSQNDEVMLKVAATAANTKSAGLDRRKLADCAYKAVKSVTELHAGNPSENKGRILVFKKVGGSVNDTRFVDGLVFDHGLIHPSMPKKIEHAKIALLRYARLELRKSWEGPYPAGYHNPRVVIKDPKTLRDYYEERRKMIREQVEKIVGTGANVVITTSGCDFPQASLLARHGIQTIIRVADEAGVGRLEKATGGKSVSTLDDLTSDDLGYARVTEEKQIGEDKVFIVDGCKNPQSVCILLQGAVGGIVDQAERAVNDAISACFDMFKDPRIVGGAGSTEAKLAYYLRKYAPSVEGKKQLAVLAFAEALEGVVSALAENSGLEHVSSILKLRAAQLKQDGQWIGLDIDRDGLCDVFEAGIIEPFHVKEHALNSAVQAACQVLRVDEILAANPTPPAIPGELPSTAPPAFPGDIPPAVDFGEKPLYPSLGPEDLPDKSKKLLKKTKYLKSPHWKPLFK